MRGLYVSIMGSVELIFEFSLLSGWFHLTHDTTVQMLDEVFYYHGGSYRERVDDHR